MVARKVTNEEEFDRRQSILLAAEELFARKGFEGASIREIAKNAQANAALIYYYFGGKENLYLAALEKTLLEMPETVEALICSADSAEASLQRILQMIVDSAPQRSYFFQILHRELASESPRLGLLADKYFARNYALGKSLMEKAISNGEFRELDAQLAPISFLAMILFFFYNRFLVQRILGLDPLDKRFRRRLVEHTFDLFLHGVSAKQGSPCGKRKRASGKVGRGKGSTTGSGPIFPVRRDP